MASVRALREKLGDEAMSGLRTVINDVGGPWKEDVLAIAGERFERRLADEIGALRVDITKQLAELRVELLKWSLLFWIGQFAAMSGMMAFLLTTMGAR